MQHRQRRAIGGEGERFEGGRDRREVFAVLGLQAGRGGLRDLVLELAAQVEEAGFELFGGGVGSDFEELRGFSRRHGSAKKDAGREEKSGKGARGSTLKLEQPARRGEARELGHLLEAKAEFLQ